jgi:ribosomal protein L5
MNLTFVTSAKDDSSAFKLLDSFGFPFRKASKDQNQD